MQVLQHRRCDLCSSPAGGPVRKGEGRDEGSGLAGADLKFSPLPVLAANAHLTSPHDHWARTGAVPE